MNVRHDRSYISENSRDLIGRGYAAEVLDTLRFRFTYTQVERDANRSRAKIVQSCARVVEALGEYSVGLMPFTSPRALTKSMASFAQWL